MVAMVLLVLVWAALTRSVEPLSLAAAVGAAVLALGIRRWILPSPGRIGRVLLRRPHRAALYAATLALRLLQSTAYTCWVVLFRREEGRILALPTALRDPIAQSILSSSVTLTPSTISLLLEEDVLYVHWLGVRGGSSDWRGIKDSLERQLLKLWEAGRSGCP